MDIFSDDNLFWDDLINEAYKLRNENFDNPEELDAKARSTIEDYCYILRNNMFSFFKYIDIFDILHFWTVYENNIRFFSDFIFSKSQNDHLKRELIELGNEKWKEILFSPIPNHEDQKSFFNEFERFISTCFQQTSFQFHNLLKEANVFLSFVSKKAILKNSPYILSLLYSKCHILCNHHEEIPELTDNYIKYVNKIREAIKLLYNNPKAIQINKIINEAFSSIKNEYWFASEFKTIEITPITILNFKDIQELAQKIKENYYSRYIHCYFQPFMNFVSEYFRGKYKISYNTDLTKSSFNQEQFKSSFLPEFEICYNYFQKNSSTMMKPAVSKMFLSIFTKSLNEYFAESIDIFNEKHMKILSSFWKYIKDSYSIRRTFKSKIAQYLSKSEKPKIDFESIKKIADFFFDENEEPHFYSALRVAFSPKETWIETFKKSVEIVPKLFSKEKFETAFICWIELHKKSLDYQPQSELFLDAFKCFLMKNENELDISFVEFLLDKMTSFLTLETNNDMFIIFNRIKKFNDFSILRKESPPFDYFSTDVQCLNINSEKVNRIGQKLLDFLNDKKKASFNQLFEEAKRINADKEINRLEVSYALNLLADNNKIVIEPNPRWYFAIGSEEKV